MRESIEFLPEQCNVEIASGVVGGRWKLAIVETLAGRCCRYGQILRLLPGITQRMLSRQIGQLEADGIVSRNVASESPLVVFYSLTDMGNDLLPIIEALSKWGEDYRRLHVHDPAS